MLLSHTYLCHIHVYIYIHTGAQLHTCGYLARVVFLSLAVPSDLLRGTRHSSGGPVEGRRPLSEARKEIEHMVLIFKKEQRLCTALFAAT